MHYRAGVIGATLDLKSQPGQGTQVTCEFSPMSRELEKSLNMTEEIHLEAGTPRPETVKPPSHKTNRTRAGFFSWTTTPCSATGCGN